MDTSPALRSGAVQHPSLPFDGACEQGAFYSTVGEGKVAMVDEGDVAAVAAQIPAWVVDFINDLRRRERNGGAAWVSPDVERVTGRPRTAYAESVRAVLG